MVTTPFSLLSIVPSMEQKVPPHLFVLTIPHGENDERVSPFHCTCCKNSFLEMVSFSSFLSMGKTKVLLSIETDSPFIPSMTSSLQENGESCSTHLLSHSVVDLSSRRSSLFTCCPCSSSRFQSMGSRQLHSSGTPPPLSSSNLISSLFRCQCVVGQCP